MTQTEPKMTEAEARKIVRPYTGRLGQKHNPDKCCASLFGDWSSYQCGNKAKTFYAEGLGYCGTHNPEMVKKKRADREAAWRKARADGQEVYRLQGLRQEFQEASAIAINSIAAGHNDPRALCLSLLEKFAELFPEKTNT